MAMKRNYGLLASILMIGFFMGGGQAFANKAEQTSYSLKAGARVFITRCSLCHGSDGKGSGPLPLLTGGYPDTDLTKPRHAKNLEEIRTAVLWGGSNGAMSPLSPPWIDELTWRETESVTYFVETLRKDPMIAKDLFKQEAAAITPSKKLGHMVFKARCTLCHGAYGEGDGKMARIIKNPPPANLRLIQSDDQYLGKIIRNGGASVGRSEHMPPWKDELSSVEINSVVLYIRSLRE